MRGRAAIMNTLYEQFKDPSHLYGLRPVWFWNGALTPQEVRRQLTALVDQGVHSAYVTPWSGLRPRYLSDGWWELVAEAVAASRDLGFQLCFADEFNWPSGEARDFTLAGFPSRVLRANPDLRMRTLVPERMCGEQPVENRADVYLAVAGRATGEGVEFDTLADVTEVVRRGAWPCPDRAWRLYVFRLREAVGVDGGLVDLMNPESTRLFIEFVYEQYYKRFADDFGTTIVAARSDHEGDYGYRLAWTPRLFDEFRERKGYDLRRRLPMLLDDGGPLTPKVRCDYFDVVSDLYADSFAGQIARWGAEHGIRTDGHMWEESLQAQAAYEGNHFAIQRAFGNPGIDTLFEWGRSPRDFLEARSVAHFRRLPLVVEHQGVQGADSYLGPERAKRTTNAIAAWGTGIFAAHAIRANPDRMDFPEDWFEAQPWWRFFHHYSDYVRRLAFVNGNGRHVCEIAVYYGIESAWAHGDPCFDPEKWDYGLKEIDSERGIVVEWGNVVDDINRVYGEILVRLPSEQWDVDVLDAEYLAEAEVEGGRLRIADESFGVLILPPMTCMRLASARRARAFADAGGLVVGVERLARDSMENGRDDPELERLLQPIPVVDGVDSLLSFLNERVHKDVRVVDGCAAHFCCLHRVLDETDIYFFVNDTDACRRIRVHVAASGPAELWDPDGGERRELGFEASNEGTTLDLTFEPWQAYYVALGGPRSVPPTKPERRPHPESSLPPLPVAGPWSLAVHPHVVPVAYAQAEGSQAPGWLSRERFTIRDWWTIGPFDYQLHLGWDQAFPPEMGFDPAATYEGKYGPVRWTHYTSEAHIADLQKAVGRGAETAFGGVRSATVYAFTEVHSPDAQVAELRLVGDSNAKAWVNDRLVMAERDDHLGYLEMRDAYAQRVRVELRAGWNRLLVKVSQAFRYGPGLRLFARFCTEDGAPLRDVVASATRIRARASSGGRRYRLAVPNGAVAVTLPGLTAACEVFLDGKTVEADSERVDLQPGYQLEVRLPKPADLIDFPQFETSRARCELGSWSRTGLAYFAGTGVYETEFDVPHAYVGRPLELDLGIVGVVAEAWLNDEPLGERVWRPFTFGVTGKVTSGRNALRVAVTNTNANRRARRFEELKMGTVPMCGPRLLQGTIENGLLGPVRLVPT